MKRLTRSQDRKLFGVCGGVAEYLSVDPTLVRIGFVVAAVLGIGAPILIYLVMTLVMPNS